MLPRIDIIGRSNQWRVEALKQIIVYNARMVVTAVISEVKSRIKESSTRGSPIDRSRDKLVDLDRSLLLSRNVVMNSALTLFRLYQFCKDFKLIGELVTLEDLPFLFRYVSRAEWYVQRQRRNGEFMNDSFGSYRENRLGTQTDPVTALRRGEVHHHAPPFNVPISLK